MIPKEPWTELYVDPRQYTRGNGVDSASIRIYDTTLRDGEQMPGVAMSPTQKYTIAKELSAIGCHILDVGFPAVEVSERTALKMILQGRDKGEIRSDMEILVMCRAIQSDIDTAISTVRELGFGPDELTFLIFTSSSDLHCKYKLGRMLLQREGRRPEDLQETPIQFFRESNKKVVKDAIQYARSRGIKNIEFGTEDASRTPVGPLIDLVRTALSVGATRYIFPDTTGSLTPEATGIYCKAISAAFPEIERVSHFHNDFDLATINSICGVLNGFHTISTTVNGIGERAGNAPLHSVVAALKYLYGLEIPNFQYDRLCGLKKLVEKITGVPVAAQEPIVGQNVYSHESGIHTHGVSILRAIYEPLPYEEVGGIARFVYGKHSGSNLLSNLVAEHSQELGCEDDQEFVAALLAEIKAVRGFTTSTNKTADYIDSYYHNLSRLGLTDVDVLKLARQLAKSRAKAVRHKSVTALPGVQHLGNRSAKPAYRM